MTVSSLKLNMFSVKMYFSGQFSDICNKCYSKTDVLKPTFSQGETILHILGTLNREKVGIYDPRQIKNRH